MKVVSLTCSGSLNGLLTLTVHLHRCHTAFATFTRCRTAFATFTLFATDSTNTTKRALIFVCSKHTRVLYVLQRSDIRHYPAGPQYSDADVYDMYRLDGTMDGRDMMTMARCISNNIAVLAPRSANTDQVGCRFIAVP